MIGAKPISEFFAAYPPGAQYLYGTVELAALEAAYVEHGRRRPKPGPLVEALDHFISEKVREIAQQINAKRQQKLDEWPWTTCTRRTASSTNSRINSYLVMERATELPGARAMDPEPQGAEAVWWNGERYRTRWSIQRQREGSISGMASLFPFAHCGMSMFEMREGGQYARL